MSGPFTRALFAKRDEVSKDIEGIRRELSRMGERLQVREAQLRNLEDLIRFEGVEPASPDVEPSNSKRPSPQKVATDGSFVDAAESLLRSIGRPLHYVDLAKRLQASGTFIPGRNPAANLLTRMTRDPRFRKTGRGTYGLSRIRKVEANG